MMNATTLMGALLGTAIFGQGEVNETLLESHIGIDMFIAKYNTDGKLVWVRCASGSEYFSSKGISALSDGSFFVTGFFKSDATFGPGEVNETKLTATGLVDMFVARYDSNGRLIWVRRVGEKGDIRAWAHA